MLPPTRVLSVPADQRAGPAWRGPRIWARAGAASSPRSIARKPTTLAGSQGLAGKASLRILLHHAGTGKRAPVWRVRAAADAQAPSKQLPSGAACSAAPASASTCASIHPLGQVIAGLQRGGNLVGGHLPVLRDVLGVLPLEEFHAVLGDRLAPEVAVRRRLLILRLAQRE